MLLNQTKFLVHRNHRELIEADGWLYKEKVQDWYSRTKIVDLVERFVFMPQY